MVKLDGVAWHGHPTKKGSIGIHVTKTQHNNGNGVATDIYNPSRKE
jgi:hypothetical protein